MATQHDAKGSKPEVNVVTMLARKVRQPCPVNRLLMTTASGAGIDQIEGELGAYPGADPDDQQRHRGGAWRDPAACCPPSTLFRKRFNQRWEGGRSFTAA